MRRSRLVEKISSRPLLVRSLGSLTLSLRTCTGSRSETQVLKSSLQAAAWARSGASTASSGERTHLGVALLQRRLLRHMRTHAFSPAQALGKADGRPTAGRRARARRMRSTHAGERFVLAADGPLSCPLRAPLRLCAVARGPAKRFGRSTAGSGSASQRVVCCCFWILHPVLAHSAS